MPWWVWVIVVGEVWTLAAWASEIGEPRKPRAGIEVAIDVAVNVPLIIALVVHFWGHA